MPSYGSKVLERQKPFSKGTTIMNFKKGWPKEYRDVEGGGARVWMAW